MPVSQADIDALNGAIAAGARSVTIGGQTITYNTTDSLIRARNDLQAQLLRDTAAAEGKPRRKVTQLYHAGRGF